MLVNRWLVLYVPGRAGKDTVFRALAKAGVHKNTHTNFKSLILAISKTGSVVVITEKKISTLLLSLTLCNVFILITWYAVGPFIIFSAQDLERFQWGPDVGGPCGSIWVFLFFLRSCSWMLRQGYYSGGGCTKKKWLAELCLACSAAFPNNTVIGWYKQWLSLRQHGPGIKVCSQNPRRSLSFSWYGWMSKIQQFLIYNHSQMLLWGESVFLKFSTSTSVSRLEYSLPFHLTCFLTWLMPQLWFSSNSFYPECSRMNGSHPTTWGSLS